MLISMTGFGEATFEDERGQARVEVRALNHRYLDISIRLPRHLLSLEERVRRAISQEIQRGRIEIFASVEEFSSGKRTVTLDEDLLRQYVEALRRAQSVAGFHGEISLETLVPLPDWLRIDEGQVDVEGAWGLIQPALQQALHGLKQMRQREGERLRQHIEERMHVLAGHLSQVAERAPVVVEQYRLRLLQRIAEWEEAVRPVADRIDAEIALFADRSNIDEELVRARSHVDAFFEACSQEGPVGRKLDFLLQELQREINTMGAKANDGVIGGLVVSMKAELEKVREQSQNIE